MPGTIDASKVVQGLILTGIAGLTAMTVSVNLKVVRIETILDERGNDHDLIKRMEQQLLGVSKRVDKLENQK